MIVDVHSHAWSYSLKWAFPLAIKQNLAPSLVRNNADRLALIFDAIRRLIGFAATRWICERR